MLDEIERTAGYGTASFVRSLETTYRQLVERDVRAEDLARVHAFAEDIRHHPMEILPGSRKRWHTWRRATTSCWSPRARQTSSR